MVNVIRTLFVHMTQQRTQSDALARLAIQTLALVQQSFAPVKYPVYHLQPYEWLRLFHSLSFQIVVKWTTVVVIEMQLAHTIQQPMPANANAKLDIPILVVLAIPFAQVRKSISSISIGCLLISSLPYFFRQLPSEKWWMWSQCIVRTRWNNKRSEVCLQDRLYKHGVWHQCYLHR